MQKNCADNAKERRPELPQVNQDPTTWRDEPYPLINGVEIVLRFDIVLLVIFTASKLDDRRQVYRCVVEGYEPDAEDLEDRYVEDEIRFVESYSIVSLLCALWQQIGAACTNALHCDVDARAHDLVPTVDQPNQQPRVWPFTSTAEWVRERGIGREVFLNRLPLCRGW